MYEQLTVSVYRFALGDCTNGGISSRHDSLIAFRGNLDEIRFHVFIEKPNIPLDRCLYVVDRKDSPYLMPLEWALNKPNGAVVAGGNYANGDSRWFDWFGHYLPLPIHDRLESWEMYNELSK